MQNLADTLSGPAVDQVPASRSAKGDVVSGAPGISLKGLVGGCLGCGTVLAVAVTLLLIAVGLSSPMVRHMALSESVTMELPEGHGVMEFSRIGLHPFGAEYSRTVTVNDGVAHPLPVNTGWGTELNLYWVREGDKRFLRIKDRGGEYLLDIDADVMMLVVTEDDGRAFYGEFTTEHPRTSSVQPTGDPSALTVWIDGEIAEPIEAIVKDHRGTYIGSISGRTDQLRYWLPKERAERQIDHFLSNDSAGSRPAEPLGR